MKDLSLESELIPIKPIKKESKIFIPINKHTRSISTPQNLIYNSKGTKETPSSK